MDFLTSFGLIMSGLCRAVAWRGGLDRSITRLVFELHGKIRRTVERFERLVARYRAGTLKPPRPRAPRKPLYGPPAPRPPNILRGGRAWVVRMLPWEPGGYGAAGYAGQLQHLLHTDPEMAEFLRAVPQAGRILRPLCHMLGVQIPPPPQPPPPPAPTGGQPPDAAPPEATSPELATCAGPTAGIAASDRPPRSVFRRGGHRALARL